jgi:hypothetical protein
MDKTSQAKLDEILKKEFNALTPGDKDFLRARESYLTPAQKEAYAEVFGSEKEPEAPKTEKKK